MTARDEPKTYLATIRTVEEYEAQVTATSAIEARQKARHGKWDEIWATGMVLRQTVTRVVRDDI